MKNAQIRVLVNNQSVMVDTVEQAQYIADEHMLDLVEVAPNVYKVMDYKKHLYDQSKKAKKQSPKTETKEAQFNLGIAAGDLQRKIKDICKWLNAGDNVNVKVKLKGREQSRPELGITLMQKILDGVAEANVSIATPKIKTPAETGGRDVIALLRPSK